MKEFYYPVWLLQPIPYFGKNLKEIGCMRYEENSDKGRRFIPSLFAKTKKAEPLIYIFDVIFFDGRFLGDLPLRKRRKILESLDFKPPFFLLPQYKLISIDKIIENFREFSSEGVVFKELNSDYRIGRESPLVSEFWRKLKFRS